MKEFSLKIEHENEQIFQLGKHKLVYPEQYTISMSGNLGKKPDGEDYKFFFVTGNVNGDSGDEIYHTYEEAYAEAKKVMEQTEADFKALWNSVKA